MYGRGKKSEVKDFCRENRIVGYLIGEKIEQKSGELKGSPGPTTFNPRKGTEF